MPYHAGVRAPAAQLLRAARPLLLILLLALVPRPRTAAQQPPALPPAPPPQGITRTPGQTERPALPPEVAAAVVPARLATATAFGERVRVEVRGMARADADGALRAAVEEIREIERLTAVGAAATPGTLAALNAAAGGPPVRVDPRLAELLARAEGFCTWTRGAYGPLGGRLDDLWGLPHGAAARPPADRLAAAAASADCAGLTVDTAGPNAALAAGVRADLWGFSRGFAVDRAVEVLRGRGAADGFVEVGWVRRAFGEGPERGGWPVLLPAFPGVDRALDRVRLHDEALAVSSTVHRPLRIAGDRYAPYLDQRTGEPAEGVVGVVAVSGLAVDAEGLAASLTVLGNREGLLRLGGLQPAPSILWLLGDGRGAPLVTYFHWSRVALD